VLCWELCASNDTSTSTCESYCGHGLEVCNTCSPSHSASEACLSTCLDRGTSYSTCESYCVD
jgi:hypothetical protein